MLSLWALTSRSFLTFKLLPERPFIYKVSLGNSSDIFVYNSNIFVANDPKLSLLELPNELDAFLGESARSQVKLEKDLGEAKMQQTKKALGDLATIVGKNSKFGKAIAIAQAIQDTYAGADKALAQGGIFGFIGAAAVIATGIANVKKIASTKPPQPPAGIGARASGDVTPAIPAATTPSLPPQFSTVGATGTNQLAELLGNQPPPRAFVVSGDVSTAQELDRNIVTSASLG